MLLEISSYTQWKDSHLGQGQVSVSRCGQRGRFMPFVLGRNLPGLRVEQDWGAEAQVERGEGGLAAAPRAVERCKEGPVAGRGAEHALTLFPRCAAGRGPGGWWDRWQPPVSDLRLSISWLRAGGHTGRAQGHHLASGLGHSSTGHNPCPSTATSTTVMQYIYISIEK